MADGYIPIDFPPGVTVYDLTTEFEIAREAARERRLRRDALGLAGLAWEDYGRRWAEMVSGDR